MKKTKTNRGINKFIKDFIKLMKKRIAKRTTNNFRKIHGLPMKRKRYEGKNI